MNKLSELKKMGFKITWKLIWIGLNGCCEIPTALTQDEAIDYLYSSLDKAECMTDQVVSLICEDNHAEFDRMLKDFAENDQSNLNIQKRKWRVFLLITLLEEISMDPLQGLLALTEFWVTMGSPPDCPHIFPTNTTVEKEYFTEKTYKFLVGKNKDWINGEIAEIIKSE